MSKYSTTSNNLIGAKLTSITIIKDLPLRIRYHDDGEMSDKGEQPVEGREPEERLDVHEEHEEVRQRFPARLVRNGQEH